jgi:hypothetical protein
MTIKEIESRGQLGAQEAQGPEEPPRRGKWNTTVKAVTANQLRVPPGPTEQYSSAEDLFIWMNENFVRYGDIYKASVFGSDVYVVSAPEYCERILRWNWQNYPRQGQVVKRITLVLGNGLIASNG